MVLLSEPLSRAYVCLRYKLISGIVAILFLSVQEGSAQNGTVKLALEDVRSYVESYSPYYQSLSERTDAESSQLDVGLQRNNPSLQYEMEYLGDDANYELEQSLFLEQTIERPRLYRSRSSSADYQHESLHFNKEARGREFISNVRSEYTLLVVLQHHIDIKEKLIEKIDRLADVGASQAEAGDLSALDRQLIELNRQSLSNELVELKVAHEQKLADWKTDMGIDSETEVDLTSEITITDISLPEMPDTAELLANHPDIKSIEYSSRAAGENIRSAELRRLPEFDVSAGYKRLNPDWNGFLVGVSVPLPVINRNEAEIEQRRAEERQLEYDHQNRRQALENAWQSNRSILDRYHSEISETDSDLLDMSEFGRRIINSFTEGNLSLTEALSSLEMGANGYAAYLSKVSGYYEALGRLEFITQNKYIEDCCN